MIRDCSIIDAPQLCAIYNHYVQNTTVTFETDPVSEDEMIQRIEGSGIRHPWLVWEEQEKVLGFACAGPWKSRLAYLYSVESTVYVARDRTGRGIGTRLYTRLLERLRRSDVHSILAGIALPNPESVALHEKLGFEKVAQFKEVGNKFGRWIDVGYWELLTAKLRQQS